MASAGPLQNDHVRESNRRLVYASLRRHQTLSRSDISRDTRLSIPTVTTIVDEFTALGLVREGGQTATRGGRPARLVHFDPGAYHVLSIDLAQTHYRAALVDLQGADVQHYKGPRVQPGDAPFYAWLDGLRDDTRDRNVRAVAVSVPGVISPTTGNVRLAPALGWDDYPLTRELERRLELPVLLENDVNALAIGELHRGQGSDSTNVAYLTITTGIGLAVVIDREIYRGSHWSAGEIGYGTLPHLREHDTDTNGTPSRAQPGPLERHLLALERRFLTDDRVALDGDDAREAFALFCDDVTVVLQNALCLLDPECLVVSWPSDDEGRLTRHLQQHLRTPSPVRVVSAALGAEGALYGAARLALDHLETELCRTQPTLAARAQTTS